MKLSNSRARGMAQQRIAFLSPHTVSRPHPPLAEPSGYDFAACETVPCFVAGVRIQTPGQAVPIEELRVGDLIQTRDHGPQRLRWIASTEVEADEESAPVEFAAGAFGNPVATCVSPSHRVLLSGWRCKKIAGAEEVFTAARDLVNGRDVIRRPGGRVTYYHIAFDAHQVVIGDGLQSESFHPERMAAQAATPERRDNLIALFPKVSAAPKAYGPHARPDIKPSEARLIRP